jgi:hypothetical protein
MATLWVAEAHSTDIVVVQSVARSVHQKIVSGINSVVRGKTVIANVDDVRTNFRSKPKLFIAIGQDALMAVRDLGVLVSPYNKSTRWGRVNR